MKEITGGVCAPKGYKAGGIRCGIKASSQKEDLALIVSDATATAAAMFTANRVKAASVLVSQEHLASRRCRGIIANSGNANACTGQAGLDAAYRMAGLAAEKLGCSQGEIAVASTGVIGLPLPIEPIEQGMDALMASLSADAAGHDRALSAIMTTDTRRKEGALEFDLGDSAIRIGGMVKGAGMIHPNMATMLAFITTDAAISAELLEKALRRAVGHSFNRVTVDGDTSTNDTIIVLANGAAQNREIQEEGPEYAQFADALEQLCVGLAKAIARDGEGATRLMTVTVKSGLAEEAAEALAKSVASSSLVKAACFGADANWGRILCAMGYSGVDFNPEEVSVAFASSAGELRVCAKGAALPFSEETAKEILSCEEVEIAIALGNTLGGTAHNTVTVWGCDLTYDYVKINGDYRS